MLSFETFLKEFNVPDQNGQTAIASRGFFIRRKGVFFVDCGFSELKMFRKTILDIFVEWWL